MGFKMRFPSRFYQVNKSVIINVRLSSRAHLIIFELLVTSSLVGDIAKSSISSSVTVIRSVELGAKQLDNVSQPLQKNLFNPSIKICYPAFQVSIALEV